MNQISSEKFIEQLGLEVYPITMIKFLLNKKKILSYFKRATEEDFEVKNIYTLDHTTCEVCKSKEEEEQLLCRQHTSIQRVFEAKEVGFDLDTNTYFYKNEIYRMVGSRLVIIYCPHPKLISGQITDSKVRKIIPITVEDKNLAFPQYSKTKQFISSELMDKNFSCWFNKDFYLVTLPKDRNNQDWCLISNK